MLAVGCLVVVLGALNVPASEAASGEESDHPEYVGVVVEEVGKGSALEKAGLQSGDVLYAWERLANPPANPEATKGKLTSFFDWLDLETEQAPRGTVVLVGKRSGEHIKLTVGPGLWEAEMRPSLSSGPEMSYSKGKTNLASEDVQAAVREWQSLTAEASRLAGAEGLEVWILLRIGKAWGTRDNWDKALESYHDAIRVAENPLVQIAAWEALGEAHKNRNEFEAAEAAYLSSLENRQKVRPESLGVSSNLNHLGEIAWARGELDRAYDYHLRALKIREQLAPRSLNMAESLNNLGAVEVSRGELSRAEDYFSRALQIVEQFSPQSLVVAIALSNLGYVTQKRLDLDRAYDYYLRALKIREDLIPQGRATTDSLSNLGLIAQARGDLDGANGYFLRSLHIEEQIAPGSLALANSLNNLGAVAQDRGEVDDAFDYFLQSLWLRDRLAPKSFDVASSLNNLGSVAWIRGELDRAYDYYLQALQILEETAPESIAVSISLNNLGSVAPGSRRANSC
jgi:tetratricopeptide (TPR) repeat protein